VVSYSPAANALVLGTNQVTATVTDVSGAVATCTFNVVIQDTTAPVLSPPPPPSTIECPAVPSFATPTVTEGCDPHPTLTYNDVITPGATAKTYSVTRTWTATDASANVSLPVSQTIKVADTTAPVAPVLSTVTTTDCAAGYAIVPVPSAKDACAGPIPGVPNMGVLTGTNTVIMSAAGTNTIIWTFTDPSGNQSTANQTVIVSTLVFVGFDSPITGTGGTCQVPLRTVNPGSNLAIKFTTTCNGSAVFVGQPKVFVYQYPTCTSTPIPIVVDQDFHIVANEWHFNLDTSHLSTGIYQIIATQADGTTVLGKAFIKLK
jgi:hypothetical protein